MVNNETLETCEFTSIIVAVKKKLGVDDFFFLLFPTQNEKVRRAGGRFASNKKKIKS